MEYIEAVEKKVYQAIEKKDMILDLAHRASGTADLHLSVSPIPWVL